MRNKCLAILIINFIIINYSCKNKTIKSDLPIIDIESAVKKMDEVYLSHYTNNIRYIVLGSEMEHPLELIEHLAVSDKLILASDGKSCFLYNSEGEFIRRIGRRGRGPGEYSFVNGMYLDKDKIFIRDLVDLNEYMLDGSFQKRYNNCFLAEGKYYLPDFQTIMLNDTLFFGRIENNTGQINYRALIVDKTGEIKFSFTNYIKIKPEPGKHGAKRPQRACVYKFDNKFFYLEPFNDTLFQLNNQFKLLPIYIFNFGKFREPFSERSVPLENYDVLKYFYLTSAFQTEKFLFLSCVLGHDFPAKRLTPIKIPLPNGKIFTQRYNTYTVFGVFDKESEKLVFSKPTSTDNVLSTSGLYNDIDAGPRFIPNQMVNDSTMLMVLNFQDLKEHILSDVFIKSNPIYIEKKKKLEEFVDSLIKAEYYNPVLMYLSINK